MVMEVENDVGHRNQYFGISSPKGNGRSPESQQERKLWSKG